MTYSVGCFGGPDDGDASPAGGEEFAVFDRDRCAGVCLIAGAPVGGREVGSPG